MKRVLGLVLCLTLLVGCGKKNNKITNKTDINENGSAKQEVIVEEISFTDIKLTYDGGITTLEATIKNNTKDNKSFTVNISLKDDSGKEVKNLSQIIEDLGSEKNQKLQTGIIGDYSNIKNVEFKIVSEDSNNEKENN